MQEIWKDIPEVVGYQASTLGRIRSVDRQIEYEGGWISNKKGKIITPAPYRGGYLHLTLGKRFKNQKVHRLVALTFIDNPNDLPIVNHKNMIKTDNRVVNLEWVSHRGNVLHALESHGKPFYLGKAIIGTKGDEILRFLSSMEASRFGFNASAIRNCLIGISRTHKGYTWQYA